MTFCGQTSVVVALFFCFFCFFLAGGKKSSSQLKSLFLKFLFAKKSEHAFDISTRQVPNARGITFRDMRDSARFFL